MGDRSAEGCFSGAHRVGVDELMIVGGISEAVDRLLRNGDPVGDTDLLADQTSDIPQCNFAYHEPIRMRR